MSYYLCNECGEISYSASEGEGLFIKKCGFPFCNGKVYEIRTKENIDKVIDGIKKSIQKEGLAKTLELYKKILKK